MRYWWVNQNQTFRQDLKGGYREQLLRIEKQCRITKIRNPKYGFAAASVFRAGRASYVRCSSSHGGPDVDRSDHWDVLGC